MAIELFAQGVAGQVILIDRRDTGVTVLLVCEEYGPGGEGGTVYRPDEPETYPMLAPVAEADQTFSLELDTSQLPAGPQRFRIGEFIRRALGLAEEGISRVELDEHEARSWGRITGETSLAAGV